MLSRMVPGNRRRQFGKPSIIRLHRGTCCNSHVAPHRAKPAIEDASVAPSEAVGKISCLPAEGLELMAHVEEDGHPDPGLHRGVTPAGRNKAPVSHRSLGRLIQGIAAGGLAHLQGAYLAFRRHQYIQHDPAFHPLAAGQRRIDGGRIIQIVRIV